jgi:hypothetical protein
LKQFNTALLEVEERLKTMRGIVRNWRGNYGVSEMQPNIPEKNERRLAVFACA